MPVNFYDMEEKIRHVASPEGVAHFGLPLGSPILPGMKAGQQALNNRILAAAKAGSVEAPEPKKPKSKKLSKEESDLLAEFTPTIKAKYNEMVIDGESVREIHKMLRKEGLLDSQAKYLTGKGDLQAIRDERYRLNIPVLGHTNKKMGKVSDWNGSAGRLPLGAKTKVVDVKVTQDDPENSNIFTISPVYEGVDRPISSGVNVRSELVDAAVQAMKDGKIYGNATVKVDVNGQTYAESQDEVIGKYINTTLKKLGYTSRKPYGATPSPRPKTSPARTESVEALTKRVRENEYVRALEHTADTHAERARQIEAWLGRYMPNHPKYSKAKKDFEVAKAIHLSALDELRDAVRRLKDGKEPIQPRDSVVRLDN